MATIITRAGKGSALTWQEGDDNIINLNTDKIEAVSDDLTPQLGGDLDANENKITTSSTTVPLTLEAYQDALYQFNLETNSETGTAPVINVNGQIHLADSTALGYGVLTTQTGSGLFLGVEGLDLTKPNMSFEPSGSVVIQASGTSPIIEILSDGAVVIQGLEYPSSDGTTGQVLTTDGAGNLSFQDPAGGGIASVSEDLTPTLGGNLNVNGNDISAIDSDIDLITQVGSGIGDLTRSFITVSYNSGITLNSYDQEVKVTGDLRLTFQNELRLADSDNTHYVGFRSPATVTANRIWTLPSADGSANQLLKTDGSGNLSWATVAGGPSYAILEANTNNTTIAANTSATLNPGWTEVIDSSNIVTTNGTTQFTLGAGTYLIELSSAGMLASGSISTTGFRSTGGILFNLYSVTAGASLHRYYQEGSTLYYGATGTAEVPMGPVYLKCRVAPTVSTTYEIRYENSGFSKQFNNFSSPGKSFRIVITKIA